MAKEAKEVPQPVVTSTVCSLCGEAWEEHGDKPDTLDCIRLLRARLAQRVITSFTSASQITPIPYFGTATNGEVA